MAVVNVRPRRIVFTSPYALAELRRCKEEEEIIAFFVKAIVCVVIGIFLGVALFRLTPTPTPSAAHTVAASELLRAVPLGASSTAALFLPRPPLAYFPMLRTSG